MMQFMGLIVVIEMGNLAACIMLINIRIELTRIADAISQDKRGTND